MSCNIITRKTVNNNATYNPKDGKYKMNDLGSVYTHYDSETGKNVATENKLYGGAINNGKSCK